ncbi:MAG: hypothetical protein ACI9O0_001171 [Paracoccaceae bacterium]|jgi:hypothetical protein
MFLHLKTFGAMVQRDCPMVWDPDQSETLEFIEHNDQIWRTAMIAGPDAQIYLLAYHTIETEQGWKFGAVQIIEALGTAV